MTACCRTPGIAKKVALTRGIVNWTDKPAIPGLNIRTTIDIKMQDIVENELNNLLTYVNADWGVAVLMEVATGDIKAISNLEKNPSAPGYIEGMNRAVLGYEPGSVIKPISMLIALEDGIVNDLSEQIPIGKSFPYAGGRGITDSHYSSSLSVAEVIEQSSNIGMTRIITRRYDAHPGGFYHRLKQIGFLEPMNTGIAGESVPRVDSVPSNRGGRISLSRQCYGYATEIPPLYTLSVYNAIANGGRYVRPRLVSRLTGEDIDSILPVTYIRDRICSEANAKKLQSMLTDVVWGRTRHRPTPEKRSRPYRRQDRHMLHDRGRHLQHRKETTRLLRIFPRRKPQILMHRTHLPPEAERSRSRVDIG